MTGRLMQGFVRLTGWLPQKLIFRMKIRYEDKAVQSRRIHGPAIIVSNHTAIYDFAAMLFVFPGRTLRYQMAEVLFRKKVLGPFLKAMGGIYLDRDSADMGFMGKSMDILHQGGVVGIFPEGRLPREGETPPLPFRPGAAFLALNSGVPVIPVWTEGGYFRRGRSHIVIGVPMDPAGFRRESRTDRENIDAFAAAMRENVMRLKELAHE